MDKGCTEADQALGCDNADSHPAYAQSRGLWFSSVGDTRQTLALFTQAKSKFFQVSEELKIRRVNDKEYEDRVRALITEKFELQKEMEDEKLKLLKEIEELKQGHFMLQKQLEEKMKMQEEDKAAQSISISSSAKGIKSLKDELSELQLAKYNLEKTIKDQERQLTMESRYRAENEFRIVQLEKDASGMQVQFAEVVSRLESVSSLVLKTEKMHRKLTQVNEHQRSLLANCHLSERNCAAELSLAKAELASLKSAEKLQTNLPMDVTCPAEASQHLKALTSLNTQLECDLERQREANQFLLSSLSDSNRLLSCLQAKLDSASDLNAGLQLELDELTSQNKKMADEFEQITQRAASSQTDLISLQEKVQRMRQRKTVYKNLIASLQVEVGTQRDLVEAHKKLLHERELVVDHGLREMPTESGLVQKLVASRYTQTCDPETLLHFEVLELDEKPQIPSKNLRSENFVLGQSKSCPERPLSSISSSSCNETDHGGGSILDEVAPCNFSLRSIQMLNSSLLLNAVQETSKENDSSLALCCDKKDESVAASRVRRTGEFEVCTRDQNCPVSDAVINSDEKSTVRKSAIIDQGPFGFILGDMKSVCGSVSDSRLGELISCDDLHTELPAGRLESDMSRSGLDAATVDGEGEHFTVTNYAISEPGKCSVDERMDSPSLIPCSKFGATEQSTPVCSPVVKFARLTATVMESSPSLRFARLLSAQEDHLVCLPEDVNDLGNASTSCFRGPDSAGRSFGEISDRDVMDR